MNLKDEITRAARYGRQLETMLDGKEVTASTNRDLLIIGYRSLLLDYHAAIVMLLEKRALRRGVCAVAADCRSLGSHSRRENGF